MSKRKSKADQKKAQKAAARDNTRVAATPVKTATPRAAASSKSSGPARAMTFGPETFKWMGIGFALVLIGLLLMAGGRGTEYNEFDIDKIYSFRRITLAPIVILSGLGVVIFAILKK
ncbi:DUF3098 domain-containing protein [Neolewinella agarilytica]|uniref:DUF3098 domain-containing protein n=1 Tax=Neolewinella agarilytica TaxID=478744 RepID=A0A1H8ZHE0_9BACT|nr:DUF3098 domain-containing protein [Neolewinella agarilytica]SEP63771.1 Protein of unknown function [Neolewinella agarilytica]